MAPQLAKILLLASVLLWLLAAGDPTADACDAGDCEVLASARGHILLQTFNATAGLSQVEAAESEPDTENSTAKVSKEDAKKEKAAAGKKAAKKEEAEAGKEVAKKEEAEADKKDARLSVAEASEGAEEDAEEDAEEGEEEGEEEEEPQEGADDEEPHGIEADEQIAAAEPGDQVAMAEQSGQAEEQVVEAPEPALVAAPAEQTSRLMIRDIVLENFKSYGYRKLIGPFHKSFSSIVGPNGSGKSNTIDALLFVFGKRAKKMRLNKVSELIHSSSDLRSPPSAKVEVTFQDIIDTGDGPEDYSIVEGSELTVCREAFRNNQSKYYVDGRPSNFTEVTQLLRKRGVDLEHNRFLILQGEVEQISLMKPKALTQHEDGLLEYLEDIVGSNRHVQPIEDAEQALEKLTEQRQERLNRLRVAERERDSLDGPRKEAEAWVSAEAERLELQALVAQAEAQRSHSKLSGLEEENRVLQGHMEEHRKRMETYEKDVRTIETEHNAHLKDYNSIKTQMEKAAMDFKEFERQDVKFTEDIAFQEQKLQKLVMTSQKEAEMAQKLVADSAKMREEAPTREKELESLERHKVSLGQKLEKVYEGLKGKAEGLRPAKEAKEAELVPLQRRLTEVRKVVEVAQTEAELLKEKQSQVADQIETVKKDLEECGTRLKAREHEGKEAARLKGERHKLVAEAKERLEKTSKQAEELTKEVTTTRAKAEEAKAEFAKEHDRGRLIRAVYEQSKAGKLHGVHGRLGDLGTIDKKYDVAVSTACGSLDSILVDSTEDAQALIEFVRREDLGRTTCICLEKIRHLEAKMPLQGRAPEDAPRLVDLIKPTKPQYQVAFYFALQNTLVANDLEQATRIGLQGRTRWRVVTLQGQLIDTSGTMSGGGHQVLKGGMRASLCNYSPEEVKGLVETYERASSRLTTVRQERQAMHDALQLCEKEIAELDLREQKCQMDTGSLQKQMDAYDARLKSMKVPTLTTGDKSKLKELEKLIDSRSGELTEIQSQHSKVEEEVRELHNQMMNIGGEELREAKQKVEDTTKKCEDMRRSIKKAYLDADNMVKNAKKAEVNAQKAKEEHVSTEKMLAVMRADHAALDDKAEAVLNSYNQLKESLAAKDLLLVGLRKKRDEVIQAASTMKSQEVDLVNEMEEKARALRDLYARIQAWAGKLEEARKEYQQLPLDFLRELRDAQVQAAAVVAADAAAEPNGLELARQAIGADLGEKDLERVVRADADARMLTLEQNAKSLKPNLTSIEEFRRADAEHRGRLAEYEAAHATREESRRQLEVLRQTRLEEFMDGFSVISMKLKEMYQMITLGGDAELELVDTLDPFSEGINFSVRPPKKSWKQITNLSGGEKTLASLSLVFALHHYKPTPLYFMDEIDAALDFRNVSIIANYIKERTKNAQFIVISLRNHMFELADLLVGIYKTCDVSKSVSIRPDSFDVKKPPLQLKDANMDGKQRASAKRPLAAIEGPASTTKRAVEDKEN